MKILQQFESLVIHDFEEEVYSYPDHAHTYFEMVFIHSGKGEHYLNNSVLTYQAGQLFLISPGDHHYFDIKENTHFTFIKFTENYFVQGKHFLPEFFLSHPPTYLMQLKSLKEQPILFEPPQTEIVRRMVQSLVEYAKHYTRIGASQAMMYQILAILGMVHETLYKHNLQSGESQPSAMRISSYIHEHIYSRDLLHIRKVSHYFNISPNYFSAYFKRTFGINYRTYTEAYRNELIEKRLLAGQMSLKQIAIEFDFTDESHFIKYFRKHKGMNPSDFRQMQA